MRTSILTLPTTQPKIPFCHILYAKKLKPRTAICAPLKQTYLSQLTRLAALIDITNTSLNSSWDDCSYAAGVAQPTLCWRKVQSGKERDREERIERKGKRKGKEERRERERDRELEWQRGREQDHLDLGETRARYQGFPSPRQYPVSACLAFT